MDGRRSRDEKRLPRTFESAARRAGEYYGRILWPPIVESVLELERQFPHLRGVWPTVEVRRKHRRVTQ